MPSSLPAGRQASKQQPPKAQGPWWVGLPEHCWAVAKRHGKAGSNGEQWDRHWWTSGQPNTGLEHLAQLPHVDAAAVVLVEREERVPAPKRTQNAKREKGPVSAWGTLPASKTGAG